MPFGIIEIDNKGTITRVTDTGGNLKESSKLELYQGILIPGIVFDEVESNKLEPVCKYILEIQTKNPRLSLHEIIRSLTLDAARKISM